MLFLSRGASSFSSSTCQGKGKGSLKVPEKLEAWVGRVSGDASPTGCKPESSCCARFITTWPEIAEDFRPGCYEPYLTMSPGAEYRAIWALSRILFFRLILFILEVKSIKRTGQRSQPIWENGTLCEAHHALRQASSLPRGPDKISVSSRSRWTSRMGGMPKRLLYSRLKYAASW